MPDDNHDVDQYQDELSEAVDDGGGCAETWERLQSLRSDETDLTPSRRNILQAIGAAGLSLTGVSTVSATGRDEHRKLGVSLTKVLSSNEVQHILKRLDHPTPKDVEDPNFGKKGPVKLYLDQAETEVVEADNEQKEKSTKVVRTTIPSDAGKLLAVQINDELVSPAFFKFNADVRLGLKRKLDLAGAVGWPEGTEATLIGTDTQAVFRRETSETEESEIAEKVDGASEMTGAFAQNGHSGYSAVKTSSSGESTRYELSPSYEIRKKEDFDINDRERQAAQGEVTIQANCDLKLTECLSVVLFPLPTPCLGCAYICVTPVPGVSQLACAICLLATCGAVILLYAACAGIQDCV